MIHVIKFLAPKEDHRSCITRVAAQSKNINGVHGLSSHVTSMETPCALATGVGVVASLLKSKLSAAAHLDHHHQRSMDAAVKSYLVVVFMQLIYTGYYVISKAAFDRGLSTHVFIFYRQVAACLLFVPLAAMFERKSSTPLTFVMSLKIFLHAILGIALSMNLYNTGLKYTSASVASAITNCAPVFVFLFAVLFRMEKITRTRSLSGMSKALGIALCLAGAVLTALYRGPRIRPLSLHGHHLGHGAGGSTHGHPALPRRTWVEGTLMMLTSCITQSLWIVLQGMLMKEYPSKLLFTTIESLFGTFQALFVALVFERDSSKWKLHLDVGLLAILYCGVFITGIAFYLQTWCLEKKGPVFLAIFTPLGLVFTLICSTLLIGERIYLGSIIGIILMVGGLYGVLWGKSKESLPLPLPCDVSIEDGKSHNMQEKETT